MRGTTVTASDDERNVASRRSRASGSMVVGGKESVPSSSYSSETPRQLLLAARKRSEAYLDVVLGIHGQCADVGVSVDERNGAPLEMAANVVSRRGTRGWERTHRAASRRLERARRGRGMRYWVSW